MNTAGITAGIMAHATDSEKAMETAINRRLDMLAHGLHSATHRDSSSLGDIFNEVRQSLNQLLRGQLEQAYLQGWLSETTIGRINHNLPYAFDNMVIESKENNAKEQHDRRRANTDRSYVSVAEKRCSKCNIVKSASKFTAHKNMKDGLHSQCMKCASKTVQEYANSPRGRLSYLLQKARKRCRTNRGYIERGIQFEFIGTTGEIADHILANRPDIGKELQRLLDNGDRPTIDRIDSTKGYSLDNIRILSASDNSKLGARNRNKAYMQEVKIVWNDGRVVIAESKAEASRIIGCNHRSIIDAIKLRQGRMPSFGCTVSLTDTAKNAKLPPVATASKTTNSKYAKALRAIFTDGTIRQYESTRAMSRAIGCSTKSIQNALKNTGRMPKYNIESIEYI